MEPAYSHQNIQFSGYTEAQTVVLTVATVSAVALTIIFSAALGPVGLFVGVATAICTLALFDSFKQRVMDAEL